MLPPCSCSVRSITSRVCWPSVAACAGGSTAGVAAGTDADAGAGASAPASASGAAGTATPPRTPSRACSCARSHTVSPLGRRSGRAASAALRASSSASVVPNSASAALSRPLSGPSSCCAVPLSQATRPCPSTPTRACSGVPIIVWQTWNCSTRCSQAPACSRRFSIAVAYTPTSAAASKPKVRDSMVRSSTPASAPRPSRMGAAAQCSDWMHAK